MKWQKCFSICLGIFAIMCILFVISIKAFNIKVFNLQSASMNPSIKEGSMILNEIETFNELKVNDIITYKDKNTGIYITHRIKKINEKKKEVLCKGDANKISDAYIDFDAQYMGTLFMKVPFVGSIFTCIRGYWGKWICFLIILLLISSVAYEVYQKKIS